MPADGCRGAAEVATYPAVAGVSQALVGLLRRGAAGTEFAGLSVALYHASNLERPMTEGISLWLYRVSVNPARNHPVRVDVDGTRHLPPLPLDLHYLLTAWAADPVQEQRLFAWAVRTLEDTPVLPAGVLNEPLAEPDVFLPQEAVELAWQPLSLSESLDLWEGVRTKLRPSASYLARSVHLTSDAERTTWAPVQTRELVVGRRS